jgi:hypothetical protein
MDNRLSVPYTPKRPTSAKPSNNGFYNGSRKLKIPSPVNNNNFKNKQTSKNKPSWTEDTTGGNRNRHRRRKSRRRQRKQK